MTFKERRLVCVTHPDVVVKRLLWDDQLDTQTCATCGGPLLSETGSSSMSPAVIGDECDVMIAHGICHPDGTPRRYTSKSEMRRVAREMGLENRVEHIPMPGSDKSPHTTRWV